MPFAGKHRHFGYKPPGEDSARAQAGAITFLVGARSLDLSAAELAHRYRLKPATAERLLSEERARRG